VPLIDSLTVRGLLSFGWQPVELKLRALNVLIGPNGSGKSNLLDILHLLRELPTNLQDAVRDRGGSQAWLHKGAGGDGLAMVDVVGAWVDVPAIYRAELRLGEDGLMIQAEQLRTRDGREELHDTPLLLCLRAGSNTAAKFSKETSSKGLPTQRSAEGGQAATALDALADRFVWERLRISPTQSILGFWPGQPLVSLVASHFRGIRIYPPWQFGPAAAVRLPQSADQPNDYLDPSGKNLGLVLSRIKQSPEAWQRVLEQFRAVYSLAKEVDIHTEGGMVQIILDEAYRTPASRLSDGTMRWLFLVTLLLDPQPGPMLAIEEPELGLHPDLMSRLAELLVDAAGRTQLIVTTHSPQLVSAFSDRPEDVVICERHGGSTEFRRLDPAPLTHWLESYSLGEAWRAGELGGNRF